MATETTTAAVAAVGAVGLVQSAVLFFISMGLLPDVLFAGMWGALAAVVFFGKKEKGLKLEFNERVYVAIQRLMVAIASCVMAGYAAPILGELVGAILRTSNPKAPIFLSAFVVGAGGQVFLRAFIKRYMQAIDSENKQQSGE